MSRAHSGKAIAAVEYLDAYHDGPRQGRIARTVTLFAYAGFGWATLVGIVYLLSSAV